MSSKPETRFYTSVHKLLPKSIYKEKMHNAYRGGTADVWYSGNADDLWAEYKWLPKLNKKAPIRLYKLLSPLQLQWLRGRHEEGRNIVVILGSPDGAWVFERLSWEKPIDPTAIRSLASTKQDVANYIRRRVCLHDNELVVPDYESSRTDVQAAFHVCNDRRTTTDSHTEEATTPVAAAGTRATGTSSRPRTP